MIKFDFAGDKPDGYFVKVPEWKLIPGSDGYIIFKNSAVYRLPGTYKRGRGFKTYCFRKIPIGQNTIGYTFARVKYNGKMKLSNIHRLIAKAFIPNPENKREVNHINGIKSDSRISNLEWVTPSENCLHALKTGLMSRRKYKRLSLEKRSLKTYEGNLEDILSRTKKVTKDQILYIIENKGRKFSDIAKEISLSEATVSRYSRLVLK